MKLVKPTQQAIQEAVQALKNDLLVAFPTETVYGLGANASSRQAIKRLYQAKGRPTAHPVIVHLASIEQLADWASDVPEAARRLGEALWPGPLTMILPKATHVAAEVTGGQNSVGLRIPSHETARALLEAFGGGVAAPSANKFGRLSPTTAEDVAHDFEHEVELVLDGGACDVGIESTIVDFTGERPRILRPGMILPEQIESIVGRLGTDVSSPSSTRAPGLLRSHYAPRTPTRLIDAGALQGDVQALTVLGKKVAVLSFQSDIKGCSSLIVASREPERYAHELYRNLRALDKAGGDVILVEAVPASEAWSGVADRLKRASAEQNGDGTP
jgi:L-threonylcarbamoyladenylate synthase